MGIQLQKKTTSGIQDVFVYEPRHADWTLDAAVAANGTLALPVNYAVGKEKVTLVIDGIILNSNNFSLIGTSDAPSNIVKMLFSVRKGAECSVSITGV